MLRSLRGKRPKVHETAFVSEFAYVVGDVEIGAYSNVWPGVVIRADMGRLTIGQNASIQDNSMIHADAESWIGDNVILGHGVVYHGVRIANNCLVGNGATVNGRVEIGEYSIVAAGAVVVENTQIPERSMMVGIPAKIRGQISDRHIKLIQRTSEQYTAKGQLFKAEGLE